MSSVDPMPRHVIELDYADRVVLSDGDARILPDEEERAAELGEAFVLHALPEEQRITPGILHVYLVESAAPGGEGPVRALFADRHGGRVLGAALRLPSGQLRIGGGQDDDECEVLESLTLDPGAYRIDAWFLRWQIHGHDDRPAAVEARLKPEAARAYRRRRRLPGVLVLVWIVVAVVAASGWDASGVTIVLIPAACVGIVLALRWLGGRATGAALRAEIEAARRELPDFILLLQAGRPPHPRTGILRALEVDPFASSSHLGRWRRLAGLPIYDLDPDAGGLRDPAVAVPRLTWTKKDPEAAALRELLATPEIAGWTALSLGVDGRAKSLDAWCDALLASFPHWARLKHLIVGDVKAASHDFHLMDLGPCRRLLDVCSALETLILRGNPAQALRSPSLSGLRRLVVETADLSQEDLLHLSTREWPRLTSLELWLGLEHAEDRPDQPATLAALCEPDSMPALRHLGLRSTMDLDDLVIAMEAWPILRQLESLDLSLGDLGYRGAVHLLASPGFRDLRRLDLRCSKIPEPEARALQEEFGDVVLLGASLDADERPIREDA